MNVNSENVVLNMITRQPGRTSLTRPGAPPASARETGETGDCLFGFGCSPLSWILVLHYVTHHTSRGLSLTWHQVTITRAPRQHGGGARTRLWHSTFNIQGTGEKNFIWQFSSSAGLTGYMFRYESLCILHGVFRDQNYYDNVTSPGVVY